MNRAYRIHVVLKATFERKATRSAKEVRAALLAHVPDGWTVEKATIHSIAKPKNPAPPKPTDRQVKIETQLGMLREIVASMAMILGNVKKPRLHLAPNRWCGDRPPGAHAHSRGKNRGLICIAPKEVLKTIRPPMSRSLTVTMEDGTTKTVETLPPRTSPTWLMAHELMHIRMPGGSHNRQAFRDRVDWLMGKYDAYKVGAWKPPERSRPWVKEELEASQIANP